MRIGSAGSTNTNLLQSDAFTFRNNDKMVADGNGFIVGAESSSHPSNYGGITLANPSGSGITILLDRIRIVEGNVSPVTVSVGWAAAAVWSAGQDGWNKDSNGPRGEGQIRAGNSPSQSLTEVIPVYLQQGGIWDMILDWPIVIREGDSFGYETQPSMTATTQFQWREV